MKNVKLLFMIIFSILFANLAFLSFKNYLAFGFLDSIPYAFVAIICLCIAGMINENMRKGI